MTEQEWLSATDPGPMLGFLKRKASDRKLRLFAVACCHRIGHLLSEDHGWPLVELAEQYAARTANPEAREKNWRSDIERRLIHIHQCSTRQSKAAAYAAENLVSVHCVTHSLWLAGKEAAGAFAWESVGEATSASDAERWSCAWSAAEAMELRIQATLVRDIFGNPFRPPAIDRFWLTPTFELARSLLIWLHLRHRFRRITLAASWLTPKVVTLAQQIYDDRAFDRLPSLADALEEAACTNGDILDHCRGPGPHVRGCWVVDGVLGKE